MILGDKNITRNGLLALKDSKPVPITAHSHEIIVPCVYTETVKKFMKAKGIDLPLSPHKLAELRKIAKETPGKYQPDQKEKLESMARGGSVIHSTTKGRGHQVVNVVIGGGAMGQRKKRKKGPRGQGRLNLSSVPTGLIRPPMVSPPALPIPPTYRTFSGAPQTMGVHALPVVSAKQEEKKEEKMADLLRPISERLDAIDRRYEEVTAHQHRILERAMLGDHPWTNPRREEEVVGRMRKKGKEEKEEVSESEEEPPAPDEGSAGWSAAAIEVLLGDDPHETLERIQLKPRKGYPSLDQIMEALEIPYPTGRKTANKLREAIAGHVLYGPRSAQSSSTTGH